MWILRKLLHPMDEIAAIEFLLDKMKRHQVQRRVLQFDEAYKPRAMARQPISLRQNAPSQWIWSTSA
jgi:hypothetical protein